ncbi:MAG: DUF2239 family protein [Pseudomonadales bacterium]|nr:DUF2239 family protein [Pseudomonadales bacterium]
MPWHSDTPCTAFLGTRLLAQGPLQRVVVDCKQALVAGFELPLLIFKDEDCSQIEVDFRGDISTVVASLPGRQPEPEREADITPAGGRGRPKLGVVAREVTLLPRHWEWLKSQPGGASVALRKLVENARRESEPQDRLRQAQGNAYRFMVTLAGAEPGFEEASRALFAQDMAAFLQHSETWPEDIRSTARTLAARSIPPQ